VERQGKERGTGTSIRKQNPNPMGGRVVETKNLWKEEKLGDGEKSSTPESIVAEASLRTNGLGEAIDKGQAF